MNTFVSGMFALFLLAGGNAAYAEEPSSVGVGFIGKLTVETACGNLDDLREILRSQNLGAIITEKFASKVCGPIRDQLIRLNAIIEPTVLGIGGVVCIVEMGTALFIWPNQVVVYRAYVALPLYLVPDCVPPGS